MKWVELFPITKQQREKLQENYQILWQEVEKFGKEYERKSYTEILSSPAKTIIINLPEDQPISFSIDAYHVEKNGTIAVCIDADGLPTLLGIKPSYHFYKRPDGSIYY